MMADALMWPEALTVIIYEDGSRDAHGKRTRVESRRFRLDGIVEITTSKESEQSFALGDARALVPFGTVIPPSSVIEWEGEEYRVVGPARPLAIRGFPQLRFTQLTLHTVKPEGP